MSNFNDFNLENQPDHDKYDLNFECLSEEAYLEGLEQKKEEEYYSELEKEWVEEEKVRAVRAYNEWLDEQEEDFPF